LIQTRRDPSETPLRVVFFTPNLSDNSLGRTYCLWELAEALGWESSTVSPVGTDVWGPLRGSRFAETCQLIQPSDMRFAPAIAGADLFIAVKPLASSLGVASGLAQLMGKPILLDIDDPDMEAQLSWSQPARRLARELRHPSRIRNARKMRKLAKKLPTIVSNPVLQSRYGGPIIPHVRPDLGAGAAHIESQPTIAFVGSNRGHKGIEHLRAAVARLQNEKFLLIVTDEEPADAHAWEKWVGSTSLEEGLAIVSKADIVVIPSLDVPFARGQLPAKLIDAMMLGRAVVVTDIEPMPWALGTSGRIVQPGSVDGIETALRELASPELRSHLGDSARQRAQSMFVVTANTKAFHDAASSAIRAV
jgi:glycosyltransferase involved in cell wall biosynthesis